MKKNYQKKSILRVPTCTMAWDLHGVITRMWPQNIPVLWGWLPSSTLWLRLKPGLYKREVGPRRRLISSPIQCASSPQNDSQDFQPKAYETDMTQELTCWQSHSKIAPSHRQFRTAGCLSQWDFCLQFRTAPTYLAAPLGTRFQGSNL